MSDQGHAHAHATHPPPPSKEVVPVTLDYKEAK
jgi:hypothetical protein